MATAQPNNGDKVNGTEAAITAGHTEGGGGVLTAGGSGAGGGGAGGAGEKLSGGGAGGGAGMTGTSRTSGA